MIKNSYYIISTFFSDSNTILEGTSPEDLWLEIRKTLSSIPRVNRLLILFSIILISFILPPYGTFNIFYKAPLEKRKKWLSAWAESQFSIFKYAFVGVRIILYGSFSQLPTVMQKTEYLSTSLKTRDYELTCTEVINRLNE
ncbi:MAG: hypothetical protein N3G21_05440 [Candidatus Hydrogenedentes bacterium]|nr:hypothetical protein [Candidatus Hydrogenedentota bacterium]